MRPVACAADGAPPPPQPATIAAHAVETRAGSSRQLRMRRASASLALPSAPVRTELHVFTPWAGSIPARGVTIDKTVKGSCTHGSEVETRFDAWHCFVGRRAYDPCFANTRSEVGTHVLCMTSPWEDATAIELTKHLPLGLANPQGNPERFPPWAMITTTHQECELVTKPLGRIGGRRINYACAG